MFQSGIKPLHFVAVRLRPSGRWESGGDKSWYWYWLLGLYLPFRRKMMSSFCCQIVGWTSVVVTVAKKNPSSGQVLLLDCWLPQRVGRCDAIWTVLSEQGIKENSLCYSSLIWLPLSVNSFRWQHLCCHFSLALGPVLVVLLLSCGWLFCRPMECSPPGSSAHADFQASILERGAVSFSRQSFRPRDRTQVSSIGRQSLPLSLEAQTLWRGTQFIRPIFSGNISAYLGQWGEVPSSFVYRKWLTSNLQLIEIK